MIQKHTFFSLIDKYIIEIPIIQRDYAQGRELPNVTYIREKFVTSLVNTVMNNEPLHLGFVYGKIEGKEKLRNIQLHKEAVEKLLYTVEHYANQFQIDVKSSINTEKIHLSNSFRFIPLDGQQRLTTLFLLHWYINMQKSNNSNNWLANFKYNNRKSALAFFKEMAKAENIDLIKKELKDNLKKQIQNYTWFLSKWDYDATVSGALVMLNQIHKEFSKSPDFDFNTIDIEMLPFTFDFLDLDELNQSDELYIKMNERGKQLTDFEHFKAWLQDFSNKKYSEVGDKEFLNGFWKKLDTEWLDFFWKKVNVDYTGLDDFYFNFLKTLAINYHFSTNSDKDLPDHLKNLLQDIRNTDSYSKEKVKYIPLSRFLLKIKKQDQENEILFELFSIEALRFIDHSFELLQMLNENEVIKEAIYDVIKVPFASDSLLNAYVSKDSFTLNLWDQTMHYTILKYFEKSTSFNTEHLKNWLRVLRNLIYNTYIQNPENLYNAFHSINDLFENYFSENKLLSEIIVSEKFELKFFNTNQLNEEKQKTHLISDIRWKSLIEQFENHNYFYGQVGFILKMAENDISAFETYGYILEELYLADTKNFLLQRALLSIGDYLVNIGSNHTFCKTETDSLRSRNENWRRVFNDESKLKILKQLVVKISELQNENKNISTSLEEIISSHSYTNDQWEYYFIQSSYPIQKCNILEIRWNSNNEIRLLQSKTVIGYHLELRTTYLKKIIEKEIDISPFQKINLLKDKTAIGHPGVSLSSFEYNNQNYQLDIRYSFKNNSYDLCFFHKTDSVNSRNMNSNLISKLNDYSYDENYRHLYKSVSLNNILSELQNLISKLIFLKNV